MKKMKCILAVVFLAILSSCSKNDDNANNFILVKKITDGSGILNITYNGNKIVKAVKGEYQKDYTYTGDLITKIEDNSYVTTYTYDNGKLINSTSKRKSDNLQTVNVYTHNTDGTISYTSNTTFPNGQTSAEQRIKLTFTNGNLTKYVADTGNTMSGTSTYVTFEYDTKNAQYKNVLGMDKLLLVDFVPFSLNNLIKRSITNTTYSNNAGYVTGNQNTWTHTYDDKEYVSETRLGQMVTSYVY